MQEEARPYHDVANLFPLMTGTEFADLKADIAAYGQREPIWLHPDGRIVDGRNRHRACVELGISPRFQTWHGDGSLVAFVVSLNLHRRHLTESQRAMIAAKLANLEVGNPNFGNSANMQNRVSQSQAADLLQVSPRSVANARTVYTDGAPELVAAVERGDVAVSAAAEVAALPEEWQRVITVNGDVKEAAHDLRQGDRDKVEERVRPHVANNTGNNEWYTPRPYIEAARCVLGSIDLDPASSDEANAIVGAERYFTAVDDGLAQEWHGRIWMNPPYSSDLIGKFADKLVDHYGQGDIPAAIVLVNNATDTAWFHKLAGAADALCFPRGRIRFWQPGGEIGAPLQGQAILYFGDDYPIFVAAFAQFGIVATL